MRSVPAVFRPSSAFLRTGAVAAGVAGLALLAGAPARAAAAADDSLLSHIPPAIRGACTPTGKPDLPAAAVAAATCKSAAGFPVLYEQFPDKDAMQKQWEADLNPYSFGYDACNASTPLNGKQSYQVGQKPVGVMSCYKDAQDGSTYVEWINNDLSILSLAKTTSGDSSSYTQLLQWWRTAGPLPSDTSAATSVPAAG
ncbi:hypothetical protein ACFY2W_34550 [Streptomyces sp. NPDC001262]|uniref:hypothetical protein n=1 Tax=Streptomyces sp. NPDC001262 TaxID=3364552 RepID=UPI0036ADA054